jgi:hypothetical protein
VAAGSRGQGAVKLFERPARRKHAATERAADLEVPMSVGTMGTVAVSHASAAGHSDAKQAAVAPTFNVGVVMGAPRRPVVAEATFGATRPVAAADGGGSRLPTERASGHAVAAEHRRADANPARVLEDVSVNKPRVEAGKRSHTAAASRPAGDHPATRPASASAAMPERSSRRPAKSPAKRAPATARAALEATEPERRAAPRPAVASPDRGRSRRPVHGADTVRRASFCSVGLTLHSAASIISPSARAGAPAASRRHACR